MARDQAEAEAAAERSRPSTSSYSFPIHAPWAARIRNAGAVFLGPGSAEVFGD